MPVQSGQIDNRARVSGCPELGLTSITRGPGRWTTVTSEDSGTVGSKIEQSDKWFIRLQAISEIYLYERTLKVIKPPMQIWNCVILVAVKLIVNRGEKMTGVGSISSHYKVVASILKLSKWYSIIAYLHLFCQKLEPAQRSRGWTLSNHFYHESRYLINPKSVIERILQDGFARLRVQFELRDGHMNTGRWIEQWNWWIVPLHNFHFGRVAEVL